MLPLRVFETTGQGRRPRLACLISTVLVATALALGAVPADRAAAVEPSALSTDCTASGEPHVASAASGIAVAAWLCATWTPSGRPLQAAVQSVSGEWSPAVDLGFASNVEVAISDAGNSVVAFDMSEGEGQVNSLRGGLKIATLRPDGALRSVQTLIALESNAIPKVSGVAVNPRGDAVVAWTSWANFGAPYINYDYGASAPFVARGSASGDFGQPEQVAPYVWRVENGVYFPYGHGFEPTPYIAADGTIAVVGKSYDGPDARNFHPTYKVSVSHAGAPFSRPEDVNARTPDDRETPEPLVHLTDSALTLSWVAKEGSNLSVWRAVKLGGASFDEAVQSPSLTGLSSARDGVINTRGQAFFLFRKDHVTSDGRNAIDLHAMRLSPSGEFDAPFLIAQSDTSGSNSAGLISLSNVIDETGIATVAWTFGYTVRDANGQVVVGEPGSGTASFVALGAEEPAAPESLRAAKTGPTALASASATAAAPPSVVKVVVPSTMRGLHLMTGDVNRLSAVWTTVTTAGNRLYGGQLGFPVISKISPNAGKVAGGTTVAVTGERFHRGSTVLFDGVPVKTTFISARQLNAVAPAHAAGVAKVAVVGQGGSRMTAASEYLYGVPAIASLTPEAGPLAGGNVVTVNGSGFTRTSVVKFGFTAAKATTYVSSTRLLATAPQHAAGGVEVKVTTGAGTNLTTPNALYAYGPPKVPTFYPSSGPAGKVVTINGGAFTRSSTVMFGSRLATVVKVTSTAITVTVPAGATTGRITVTNPLGSATSTQAFKVT